MLVQLQMKEQAIILLTLLVVLLVMQIIVLLDQLVGVMALETY